MRRAATPSNTTPKITLTVSDFNLPAISLDPAWLPRNTETTQRPHISQSGRAAVNICDRKLDAPEKVTTMADVAAASFVSSPAMYRRGTTKEPPPLPINPAKKPSMLPLEIPKMVFPRWDNSPLLGFQPLSISTAAAVVNNANIRITGLVGRLIFTQVPTPALPSRYPS
jgi:hypothetical protein